jgi:hypothetical protein
MLGLADRVVPMWDVHKGDRGPGTIGLRHDVDDNPGSFQTALAMAAWEADQGFASTFFLLHGAHYWPDALEQAPRFEELGHEVGIHVNAIAVALQSALEPAVILERAVAELRQTGVTVRGCVAHGDNLCHKHGFVNDEMFTESARPTYGAADRRIAGVQLAPVPRAWFGLDYDANWLPRARYLSDSGGHWSEPFQQVADAFPRLGGQLHMLIHPDWWGQAFVPLGAAA